MTPLALYSAVFLLALLVTSLAAALTWEMLERAARKRQDSSGSTAATRTATSGILRNKGPNPVSLFTPLREKARFIKRLEKLLLEADLDWSVAEAALGMSACAGVTLAVLLLVDWVPILGACFCAAAAASGPIAYARRRRAQRVRQVEEQLPEALDHLSRLLASGQSLPLALGILAQETAPPLSTELRKAVDEYDLGRSMQDALRNMTVRLPSVDIQFFVSAIRTQSRTGGGLHDILARHAETIRERGVLRGQVRALTAHGRMTAITLSLLPFLVVGGMVLVNSSYMMLLIEEPLGKTLLFVALCAQILAYFVIRRIVDIKV